MVGIGLKGHKLLTYDQSRIIPIRILVAGVLSIFKVLINGSVTCGLLDMCDTFVDFSVSDIYFTDYSLSYVILVRIILNPCCLVSGMKLVEIVKLSYFWFYDMK